jgi:hypothetical protein
MSARRFSTVAAMLAERVDEAAQDDLSRGG